MPPRQSHPAADPEQHRGAEDTQDIERLARSSHTSGPGINDYHDSQSSGGPASSLPRQNGVASPRHAAPPAAAAAVAAAFEPTSPPQPPSALNHAGHGSTSVDASTTGTASQHALDARSDDGPRQSPPPQPSAQNGPKLQTARSLGQDAVTESAPGLSSSGGPPSKTPEIAHRLPLSSEAEQSVAGELGHSEHRARHEGAIHAVKKEEAGPGPSSLQDHQRTASAAAEGKQSDDDTKAPSAPAEQAEVVSSAPAPQSYPPKPYEHFAS